MIVFPNAKINLGLHIVSKRNDGYHNLETCFYPIEWADALELHVSDKLSFESSNIFIPSKMESNLCIKAYDLLKTDFDIPPVSIHLRKNIPIGAGLGGGSADASFTLLKLNEMFDLNISENDLCIYASKIGADCPFFIKNEAVYAEGIGDEFSPLNLSLKGLYIALVYPKVHISTKMAYSGVVPKTPEQNLKNILENENIKNWKNLLKNDFEDSVFPQFSKLKHIKSKLYEEGALYSAMTGSGSTIFGVFENKPQLSFSKQYTTHVSKLK